MAQVPLHFRTIDQGSIPTIRTWMLCLITIGLGVCFLMADHQVPTEQVESRLDEIESGNPFRRVGVLAVGVLGCLLLLVRSNRSFSIANPLAVFVIAYWTLCLFSQLWAESSELASRRRLVCLLCFLAAAGISRHLSPRDLCRVVLVISTAYLCLGIFVELAGAAERFSDGRYRFQGTLHPNRQGLNCLFLCLSAASLYQNARRYRQLLLALLLVGAFFLLLTGSRTSLYALIFSAGTCWWLNTTWQRKGFLLSMIAVAATAVLLFATLMQSYAAILVDLANIGRDGETATNLTGRLPVWTELAALVQTKPLLGFGYQSFWNIDRYAELEVLLGWVPTHAHSAYFENTLGTGLIGLTLFLMGVIVCIFRATGSYKSSGNGGYLFIVTLMLAAMAHAVFESAFAAPNSYFSCVFSCALFIVAFQQNDANEHDKPSVYSRGRSGSPYFHPKQIT